MNKTNEIITNRIIKAIEAGDVLPWSKPWNTATLNGKKIMGAANAATGNQYHGINQVLLSLVPFESPLFLTYKQAQELGGYVRKGETGLPVVKYGTYEHKTRKDSKGNPEKVGYLRYYTVFNVSQCDNLPAEKLPTVEKMEHFDPIAEAEAIISGYPNPPKIKHEGGRAFYRMTIDSVTIPERESFKSVPEYYSTIFHELAHSTGHCDRLNRKEVVETNGFGSRAYSKEELTAELTSCFLCSYTGIESTIDNSTAYVQSWLKALKNDPNLIISAAGKAQKAFDHILAN